MPTRNYTVRLVTRSDPSGVDNVTDSYQELNQAAQQAQKAIEEGDSAKALRAFRRLSSGAKRAREELDKLEASGRDVAKSSAALERLERGAAGLAKQIPGATRGTRNFGFAALEASRAVEDLQFGIAGVLNNIPGLVTSLGGAAGLTAVISLAAVGLFQLSKAFGQNEQDLNALEQAANATAEAYGRLVTALAEAESERVSDAYTQRLERQLTLLEAQSDEISRQGALERERLETAKALAQAAGEDVSAFDEQFRQQRISEQQARLELLESQLGAAESNLNNARDDAREAQRQADRSDANRIRQAAEDAANLRGDAARAARADLRQFRAPTGTQDTVGAIAAAEAADRAAEAAQATVEQQADAFRALLEAVAGARADVRDARAAAEEQRTREQFRELTTLARQAQAVGVGARGGLLEELLQGGIENTQEAIQLVSLLENQVRLGQSELADIAARVAQLESQL